MFRSPKILAVVVLSLSLFGASCKDGAIDGNSEVVAKVGSREITMREVDSVIKQQLDAGGGTALSAPELVAARLNVLETIIQEEALYQKAQRENLVPDDNRVNQELQKRKQDAGLTEEQFQENLRRGGITENDLRDRIRRELAINALRDREKTRVNAPTDAEIEKYYNDRKQAFVAERGVFLSMIVTDPANNGAADDAIGEAAAETKIRAIYEQLRGGADFATIASQRSEDQSALRAGNLGFASEAMLKQTFPTRPELPGQLMALNAGQYTEPLKDNVSNRWFIFKVNNKREQSQPLTLNDVRKDITDLLTQQRQQILLTALVSVAMTEARIQNTLAQRIVENPQQIVEFTPSPLLQQNGRAEQGQPAAPQPRIENENQPAANANRPAPAASGNANGNANR